MPTPKLTPQEEAERLQIEESLKFLHPAEAALLRNLTEPDPSEHLLDFITYTFPSYKPDPFHALVAEHLDALLRKDIRKLIVTAPPQFGKCVSADTPVLMSNGELKFISDIQIGDRVVSTKNRFDTSIEKVVNVFQNEEKSLYAVTLRSGQVLKLTASHPLLTINGWKEVKLLKPGDSIAGLRNLPQLTETPMKPGLAAILGYLTGDGCVSNGQPSMTISDPDTEIRLGELCALNDWVLHSLKPKYAYSIKGVTRDKSPCWIIDGHIGKTTAYTKRVPKAIFTGSSSDIAEFLAAYFECDGTVNPNTSANIEYYSVSKDLLLDTQHLLFRLGIYSYLNKKLGKYKGGDHHSFRLVISGKNVVKFADLIPVVGEKGRKLKDVASAQTEYRQASYSDTIPEGWQKYLKNTTWWHRKNSGIRADKKCRVGKARHVVDKLAVIENNPELQSVCNPDGLWEQIVTIEYIGEHPTYDIEVENTHNFLIGNIISHNSQICSVHFPAFWLGKRPDDQVILASYSAGLAESKGRAVRELLESPIYSQIFPAVTTKSDSRSVALWQIQGHQGQMLSIGVGGGVTGHPGKLVIIDDPIENMLAAKSSLARENLFEWYQSTLLTRAHEDSCMLIVMTRWHELDIINSIINTDDPGDWVVLRLPALGEAQKERDMANAMYNLSAGLPDPLGRDEGESLAPQRFSKEFLLKRKRTAGSIVWNAEYMGAPTNPEGNRIKRDWFTGKRVTTIPDGPNITRVRYWDKAGTDASENKHADYTVGLLMAYDSDTNYSYIENLVRGQWSSGKRDPIIVATAEADAAKSYINGVKVWHEQEPGAAGKDTATLLDQKLKAFSVFHETASGDKLLRLDPFASALEGGYVYIMINSDTDTIIDELCSIPTGRHDDIGDGCSGAYNKLSITTTKKRELESS
jgi:predicted phage terminase large subunit-like protein